MPEISELRTDADDLDFLLSGRKLLSVTNLTTTFEKKCTGFEELNAALPLTVKRVRSRSKKLYIHLTGGAKDWWIVIAYIMTGGVASRKVESAHVQFDMSHCWIGLDRWYYRDARRLGWIEATCDSDRIIHQLTDFAKPVVLGYDEKEFQPISYQEFSQAIYDCGHKYLAAALSDQRTICSGIGRYIISDAFYEAKLDPWVRCDDMSEKTVRQLWDALHLVITDAYESRGCSFQDYRDIKDEPGSYTTKMRVYGKSGKTAPNGEVVLRKKAPGGVMHYVASQVRVKD